jgi:hypothetical protein
MATEQKILLPGDVPTLELSGRFPDNFPAVRPRF